MKRMWIVFLVLSLSLATASCGKKGDLDPPSLRPASSEVR